MGRAERRRRRQERREDEWNEQALGEQAAVMGGMAFNENDELVPEEETEPPDPWEKGEHESERHARARSDRWRWARLGTVHDVAALFGIHWKTAELWRRKQRLPFVRVGGVIRYDLSDVLQWASARKEGI